MQVTKDIRSLLQLSTGPIAPLRFHSRSINRRPCTFRPLQVQRCASIYHRPSFTNEPSPTYAPGTPDFIGVRKAYQDLKATLPVRILSEIGTKETSDSFAGKQLSPTDHAKTVAEWTPATSQDVKNAIDTALAAKPAWENTPFEGRVACFYRAAELISTKYRHELIASVMIGQGKNIREAEIDIAAEACDFLRFNAHSALDLYEQQPAVHNPGMWNRMEYRPLEGFVYAISPFNFTALATTLVCGPLIMGNVVVWKPSPYALHSSWLLYKVLLESGLPKGVIQFVAGDADVVTDEVLQSPHFAALNYTGSTHVFKQLIAKIGKATGEDRFINYPRIVGETGGKNFHLLHTSADVDNAVNCTIRGAFEFQGQKCSASSRCYVPESLWPEFRDSLQRKVKTIRTGTTEDPQNFVNAVIHEQAWDRVMGVIETSKTDSKLTLLAGGTGSKEKGYYIEPTIFQTSDPNHDIMKYEYFGPLLAIYVYPDNEWKHMPHLIDHTSKYALTGAVFAKDVEAIRFAEDALKHSAGNFYINAKSTGSVVGQQPFGGMRGSGTNDKVGSQHSLSRFTSIRTIKEDYVGTKDFSYPNFKSL